MSDLEQEPKGRLSRRQFLELLPAFAGVGMLSACGEVPKQTSSPVQVEKISIPTSTPTNPESVTINGEYSNFVIENDLIARSITRKEDESDEEFAERQIQAGVNYLRKFSQATSSEVHLNKQLPHEDIKLLDNNFPIAIPPQLKTTQVIDIFLMEYDSQKTTVSYDPIFEYNMGARSEFENIDGKWTRKSFITTGKRTLAQSNYAETRDEPYQNLTDLEIAVLLIHEFGHNLQEEMLLQRVTSAGNENIPDITVAIEQNRTNKLRELDEMYKIQTQDEIFYNEAQANALAFLFLYEVNRLNGKDSKMPGSRFADPLQSTVLDIQQNGDPKYINLYESFLQNVLKTGDSCNPVWLAQHTR